MSRPRRLALVAFALVWACTTTALLALVGSGVMVTNEGRTQQAYNIASASTNIVVAVIAAVPATLGALVGLLVLWRTLRQDRALAEQKKSIAEVHVLVNDNLSRMTLAYERSQREVASLVEAARKFSPPEGGDKR